MGPRSSNLCVCPCSKLRANHSPNPGLRKSLIFGGTSAWKSKKSEKSKMSNRFTFEFAVKFTLSRVRHCSFQDRAARCSIPRGTAEIGGPIGLLQVFHR